MNSYQEIHYPFHFLHDKLISSLLSHLGSRERSAGMSLIDLFSRGFGYGSWMFQNGGCGDYREEVMFVRKVLWFVRILQTCLVANAYCASRGCMQLTQ